VNVFLFTAPPAYHDAIRMDKSPDACEENPGFSPDEVPEETSNSGNSTLYGVRSGASSINFLPKYVTYGTSDHHRQ